MVREEECGEGDWKVSGLRPGPSCEPGAGLGDVCRVGSAGPAQSGCPSSSKEVLHPPPFPPQARSTQPGWFS